MDISEDDKRELRKMLSSRGWKIVEEILKDRVKKLEAITINSMNDPESVRHQIYDEVNLRCNLIMGIKLANKVPYEILNRDAENWQFEKLNDNRRESIKDLER